MTACLHAFSAMKTIQLLTTFLQSCEYVMSVTSKLVVDVLGSIEGTILEMSYYSILSSEVSFGGLILILFVCSCSVGSATEDVSEQYV